MQEQLSTNFLQILILTLKLTNMSNFGAKLAELLERRRMTQAEFSRLTGLTEAMISRWINGQQKFVSSEDLAKLAGYISPHPKEQAELVRSHLYDEMAAPGAELIDIRIRGQTTGLKESPPVYKTALPLNLQRALEVLGREAVTDADVRATVLGLAEMLDRRPRSE